jgi:hypothetical protein
MFFLAWPVVVHAQQPFLTDDADVTSPGAFHLELLTEHDLLQHTAYPHLRQTTTRLQFTYGLSKHLEVGVDGPMIQIVNATASHLDNAFGLGDVDFQAKYCLWAEREGSRRPAISFAFAMELPTGNTTNQLGSGIADYWLNGIVQKSLGARTTLRINTGILFSGNTLTGVIGVQSARGAVFTGGSSITHKLGERWIIGVEIAGALTQQFELGKGQLQVQFGGKFALRKRVSLDYAVTGGRFEGSPRLGGALGLSVDF